VDFRALVRDLSHGLAARVEMRQIGVRDEAKLFGALGHCGRELCCSTWLRNFAAVSIRMAKTQNLALSPNKVSGLCGRLMCCLSYEHEAYAAASKCLPRSGKRVLTCKGPGKVMSIDVLGQKFSFMGDDGARHVMEPDDVEKDEDGKPQRPPPRGAPQQQDKPERRGSGGNRRPPSKPRSRPRNEAPERGAKERPDDRPASGKSDGKPKRRPRRSRKGRNPSGGKEPQS